MVSNHRTTWLFAWIALVVLAPRALAQVPANSGLDYPSHGPSYEDGDAPFAEAAPKFKNIWPFKPGHVGSYAEPFAPAQTSNYGNGPRPNVGWWGGYERLFWSLSRPDMEFLGAPPINTFAFGGLDSPTVDNSFIEAIGAWGNRWEFGYMDNDNYGWAVSILDHVSQGQFQVVNEPVITFGDPRGLLDAFVTVPIPDTDPQQDLTVELGQVPSNFDALEMKNITTLNGVEAMRIYRAPRLHNGGYFEVSYGARFFQIDDAFSVKAFGGSRPIPLSLLGTGFAIPANALDESFWGTRVQDNLVGAQIGLRWFRQQGHWLTSVEGRFMAAANFENVSQVTQLGSEHTALRDSTTNVDLLFANLGSLGSRTHENSTVFSPMGELRVLVSYVVTAHVNVKAGYNGLVVGNISRASNRVDYNSEKIIGITPKSNNEIFFVNGLSFGVEVNH